MSLPLPADLGLTPDQWWPGQAEGVSFLTTSPTRARLLIAPTGTGKTVVKLGAALLLGHDLPDSRAYSLTITRQLQDQETRALPTIHTMKGQANYDCMAEQGLVSVEEGPCHSGWSCPSRSRCAYYVAKDLVLSSPVTSMNYAVYLTDRRYRGHFPSPDIWVGDEVHNLEQVLTNTVTIEVSSKVAAKYGLTPPPADITAAVRWAWQSSPLIKALIVPYTKRQSEGEQLSKDEYQDLRRLRALLRTLTDLATLKQPTNWVCESSGPVTVWKPIWVRDYTDLLWGGAGTLLLTSATIPDPTYFADCLSLGSWSHLSLPSTFDPKRRPVILDPITLPLTYATESQPHSPALAQMVTKVDSLIAAHPLQKGVVHCGSYRRAEVIRQASEQQGRLVFVTADTKDYWLRPDPHTGLTRWETDPRPLVMVSPSVWEGVDMPGAQNEFQVICKVPYPSLGSPWVQARMQQDPLFYPTQTCLALVQTTGRSMRHHQDYGRSYIIDPAINQVLDKWHHLLQDWWLASVVRPPRPGRPTIRPRRRTVAV